MDIEKIRYVISVCKIWHFWLRKQLHAIHDIIIQYSPFFFIKLDFLENMTVSWRDWSKQFK
jgi:hypothetical protein